LVAGDLEAALDHYADDAAFHVAAWHRPLAGREEIRDATETSVGLSDYRYTIRSIATAGELTFVEVVDEFTYRGKHVTMHWAGVWEIDQAGKIRVRRDYWDAKELEAQLS
jgi:limonene-1,2-epoxide hydrolase